MTEKEASPELDLVDSAGESSREERPQARPLLGMSYVVMGVVLLVSMWKALQARWRPVDVLGTLWACGAGVAGALLLLRHRLGIRVAIAVSGLWALMGACVTTALVWSAASIVGLYGPVGSGGALILSFVAMLVVPYMLGVPVLQIYACLRTDATRA